MSTFYKILAIFNSLHLLIFIVLIIPPTLVKVNLGQSGRSKMVQLDDPKDFKWTVLQSYGERSKSQNLNGINNGVRGGKYMVEKTESGRPKVKIYGP